MASGYKTGGSAPEGIHSPADHTSSSSMAVSVSSFYSWIWLSHKDSLCLSSVICFGPLVVGHVSFWSVMTNGNTEAPLDANSSVGLEANADKTKHMVMSSHQNAGHNRIY
jgi:hypothetical protein